MRGHRQKPDYDWYVADEQGRLYSDNYTFGAQYLAVLMDIRAELKKLNSLLHCQNATDIPHILRDIKRNTTKPKRRRVKR